MARQTITVTSSWQQVGSGVVAITIKKQGSGSLLFNESATDTNASEFTGLAQDQFTQDAVVDTFVRSAGSGWEILVDGVL